MPPTYTTILSLFFVDIEKSTNNLDTYKLKFLVNTKIVAENPHPLKNPLQCYMCQFYGHTLKYCHQDPRCIRYGEEHRSDFYTKPCDSPAKCAICDGSHPAKYKGCQKYKYFLIV